MNDAADNRAAQLRRKFLNDAADLLFTRSLSLSAHLSEIEAGSSQLSKATNRYCVGCGVRLLPGWSCAQVRGLGGRSRGKDRVVTQQSGVTLFACKLCHEHVQINKSSRMKSGTAMTTVESQVAAAKAITTNATGLANKRPQREEPAAATSQISTGRRKARSKHATLQALLGKQKEQTASQEGFGLGFQDLLKK